MRSEKLLRLSVVIKLLETIMFQEVGSFETLGSKLSLGTSKKVADVRNHLRKVLKRLCLQSNSVVVNWVSLLILEKLIERYRASGVCHGGSWYHDYGNL